MGGSLSVLAIICLSCQYALGTEYCVAPYSECDDSSSCHVGSKCEHQRFLTATCVPDEGDDVELFGICNDEDLICGEGSSCVEINDDLSQCLWDAECVYGDCIMSIAPLTPIERVQNLYAMTVDKARDKTLKAIPCHENNGDEEAYSGYIGNFHKTLPHDEYGEVDPEAYEMFLECLRTGDIEICSNIPGSGKLANPLGGLSYHIPTSDNSMFAVPAPPSISSPEMSAMFTELIWMALLRDVPFSEFESHPIAKKAAHSLANHEGYYGMGRSVCEDDDGSKRIDPRTQLFRMDLKDAMIGPAISQFLLKNFDYDGIDVTPKTRLGAPGSDYVTDYNEWLTVQNGENTEYGFDPHPDGPIYPRTPRDLAAIAFQDVLFTPFFRSIRIMTQNKFKLNQGPYMTDNRNRGLTTWGSPQMIQQTLLMGCDLGPVWYSKWNVNRYLRPEAFGGLLHLKKTGIKNHYPIHDSLLESEAVEYLYQLNKETNLRRNKENSNIMPEATYLLPQTVKEGSLTHPSYPAGHAIVSGAAGTILKAWFAFDEETESTCFPDPVIPLADGSGVEPYVAPEGERCITIVGEINKLVQNIAQGREMSGMHYRVDSWEGILQGEANAIAFLQERIDSNFECEGEYSFTSFEYKKISIKPSSDCKRRHMRQE